LLTKSRFPKSVLARKNLEFGFYRKSLISKAYFQSTKTVFLETGPDSGQKLNIPVFETGLFQDKNSF